MVDLKNKELIKVMWLPEEKEVLFNIKNETVIPIKSKLNSQVFSFFDIDKWKRLYAEAYDRWLNKDDSSIYEVNNPVNQSMIDTLIKVNESLEREMIFYWFDIDRTYNENFKWEFCPMSNQRLIFLGDEYPKINSLISPEYPLIFPLQFLQSFNNETSG
jgi:hypothetical protein